MEINCLSNIFTSVHLKADFLCSLVRVRRKLIWPLAADRISPLHYLILTVVGLKSVLPQFETTLTINLKLPLESVVP